MTQGRQVTILLRYRGDEMQVGFDHEWQANAFERLFTLLVESIEHNISRDRRIEFGCETTLQYQLAREKNAELEKILQLEQLGFRPNNQLVLTPKPVVVARIDKTATA